MAELDRPVLAADIHRALQMLHEQAHDTLPIRICQEEPCRSLPSRALWHGPAPLSIVGVPSEETREYLVKSQ